MSSRPGRQRQAGEATFFTQRPGRLTEDLQMNSGVSAKQGNARQNKVQPVFLVKSETTKTEREALSKTGGVISRANGNPKIKDYVEALRKMGTTYASWQWNPIPVGNGILFKFPSEGGLNILTKRDVIPCNNGHFVVSRWKEDGEGNTHQFPVTLTVLAFNVPPYLRSEPELARIVANFAHLIEAMQVMEEGGPMKLTVGCRRKSDVPRELVIVYGGREFKINFAVREVLGEMNRAGEGSEEFGRREGGDQTEGERTAGRRRADEGTGEIRKRNGGDHTSINREAKGESRGRSGQGTDTGRGDGGNFNKGEGPVMELFEGQKRGSGRGSEAGDGAIVVEVGGEGGGGRRSVIGGGGRRLSSFRANKYGEGESCGPGYYLERPRDAFQRETCTYRKHA